MNLELENQIEKLDHELASCTNPLQLSNLLTTRVETFSGNVIRKNEWLMLNKHLLMHLIGNENLRPAIQVLSEETRRNIFEAVVTGLEDEENYNDAQRLIDAFGDATFVTTAFEVIHGRMREAGIKVLLFIAQRFTVEELNDLLGNDYLLQLVAILSVAISHLNQQVRKATLHFLRQSTDSVHRISRDEGYCRQILTCLLEAFQANKDSKWKVRIALSLLKLLENGDPRYYGNTLNIVLSEFAPPLLLDNNRNHNGISVTAYSFFNLVATHIPEISVNHYRDYLGRMKHACRDDTTEEVKKLAIRGLLISATHRLQVDEGQEFRQHVNGVLNCISENQYFLYPTSLALVGEILLSYSYTRVDDEKNFLEWLKLLEHLPFQEFHGLEVVREVHALLPRFVDKYYRFPFPRVEGLEKVLEVYLEIINEETLARQNNVESMKKFVEDLWGLWSTKRNFVRNKYYKKFICLRSYHRNILRSKLDLDLRHHLV